jgi:hypothetical protein
MTANPETRKSDRFVVLRTRLRASMTAGLPVEMAPRTAQIKARLSVLPSQSASHPSASMQETQTESRAFYAQEENPILP